MARGKAAEKGNILKRQILALELRKMGLSYRKIAERLDVSLTQAYRDITDELTRLSTLKQEGGEDLRQLQLERLDMAIEGVMPFVQAGSAAHVAAYSGVIEKQSKIAGILTSADVTININIEIVQRFETAARDAGLDPAMLLEQFIQELHAQHTGANSEDNN